MRAVMRASIRDAGRFIRQPKSIAALTAVFLLSAVGIELFGYLIWRRFPTPVLIITTAVLWLGIAKAINQPKLSAVIRLMAIGLCGFGAALVVGAFVDAVYFPALGYCTFTATVGLWGWFAFYSYRALIVLTNMSPAGRERVTSSSAVIIAEMTATEDRLGPLIEASENVLGNRFVHA